jgi:dTDP-4-amino-4,6-dideoxygalactose transaminase
MNFVYWLNKKHINMDNVASKISECIESRKMTNNGINVIQLQETLKKTLDIKQDKEAIAVCSCSAGISALTSGLNMYYNKKLRWAVQAFSFGASNQGLLHDSIIFDIDENMGPSIEKLENHKDEYDGIMITNCFGNCVNISLYEKFCEKNNKFLIFDNAACPLTYYKRSNTCNYGVGSIISLHQTKIFGFGEGGCIFVDKMYADCVRKAICFGLSDDNRLVHSKYASNYKMSEIAAIFINDYFTNYSYKIIENNNRLLSYFIKKVKKYIDNGSINLLKSFSSYEDSLLPNIPIVFNCETSKDIFIEYNIEAGKYYYPLDVTCENSMKLFKNMVCLPLHLDIDESVIDLYVEIIEKILAKK